MRNLRHSGWLCAWLTSAVVAAAADRATNVIVFIGDGMGLEHVAAARCFKGAPLCFEPFEHFALVDTDSLDGTTDSAAAGTALATGQRVANGVLSVAMPGDESELRTVLEYFRDKGKRTGLVTTDPMTGATPAAFGAHAASRDAVDDVAGDYLNQTRPNVLYGGGADGLDPALAAAAGYVIATDAVEMLALDPAAVARVSGQFGEGQMPYEFDGVGALPHLWEMTSNALAILENGPAGLFLMVEGANIDHASHLHDMPRMVQETLAFDAAVQVALDWATNRTDTLILVTADHETCGLIVTNDNGSGNEPDGNWTASWHTSANVGCWAWGAGAERIAGAIANTNVHAAIVASGLFQAWCAASIDEPASMALTWSASAGEVFRVECAESLEAPQWQPLGVVTAAAAVFTFIDADVAAASNRIYRAVSLP